MNSRTAILLLSGAAALALIAFVSLVYFAGASDGPGPTVRANGAFLHPQVVREDRPGYVIAELYQDVHLDVASGFYDRDGALHDRYWNHDQASRTCTVELVLADQHGRDEIAATATPRPTHTPRPTDPPWDPEEYQVVERTVQTDHGAGIALALLPTPRADWPTSTPRPTHTPYPTATPTVTAATDWDYWKGRPVAIRADGLVKLDVPRDARVSGHLSVRTGPDSNPNSQSELARMPLPDARWEDGSAHLALSDASGRILLESDEIDANYRSAVLRLEAAPLPDCRGLNLRWPRAAAVVVTALTHNPFADWGGRAAPPVAPPAAGIALYAAVGDDASFDADDLLAGAASTTAGYIVIPPAPCRVALQEGQTCDPANREDGHIAFAVRADLAPSGLADVRQSGAAFNARGAFAPAVGDADVVLDLGGIDFKLYVSSQPWRASLLGREWSLAP